MVSFMSDPDRTPTPSTAGMPWAALLRLIRFHNPSGTWLLALPSLWALTLAARGLPPLRLTVIFLVGAFLMRSAGVILNDLADRSFDRHVARTRSRPLASGELSSRHAIGFLAVLLAGAAALLLLLPPLTRWLAPVALLLATLYPFCKRILHIPQAVLGVAFGWGTIMAWAAVRDTIETPAWLIFGSTVAWAIAYDTIYALQDQEDDRRIGVRSSALFFGQSTWLAVGLCLTVMLGLLFLAGSLSGAGWMFNAALSLVGIFFARQTHRLAGTNLRPEEAFQMFKAHVWAGAILYAGLIAGFSLPWS